MSTRGKSGTCTCKYSAISCPFTRHLSGYMKVPDAVLTRNLASLSLLRFPQPRHRVLATHHTLLYFFLIPGSIIFSQTNPFPELTLKTASFPSLCLRVKSMLPKRKQSVAFSRVSCSRAEFCFGLWYLGGGFSGIL